MSIWGINDSSSLTDLYQTYLSQSNSTAATDDDSTNLLDNEASKSQSSVDAIIFSPKGQIYSKLSQLQSSDPAKFKETCSEIAEGLRNTPNAGSSAATLAAKFEKAAETGKMTPLTASNVTSSYGTTSSLSNYLSQFGTGQSSGDDDTALLQAILAQKGISI